MAEEITDSMEKVPLPCIRTHSYSPPALGGGPAEREQSLANLAHRFEKIAVARARVAQHRGLHRRAGGEGAWCE